MNDFYDTLNRQVQALFDGEDDVIAALANFSALLNDNLEDINWIRALVLIAVL